jgi:hypothetical protein
MIVEQKKPRPRHELKYHVDWLNYQVLSMKLATVLDRDPHAGSDGRYHVRNLYFDDFKNTALCDKICGVIQREKYRMRIYNLCDDFIKFERKSKINQFVFKENVRISREEANRMIAGDATFLANSENHLLRNFYLETRNRLMRPVVLVDYYREAYVHPVGNVRVTFDINLHTNMGSAEFFNPKSFTVKASEEQGVIMEVKFDDVLPQYIRGLIPNAIRPRTAIGKFAICRELNSRWFP